ncbi:hypothetical protein AC579_10055 [Pseudocercospora musae]|uniref:F-box domain-containing protein n=1 Tax=Pseudocercospora musae TaxID=113226 RepID=A0A139I6D2_9PEZI|nr:hypothetical protein AC579_10055 [Pseudocercospora musae]
MPTDAFFFVFFKTAACMHLAMTSQAPSASLLGLPYELRIEIYSYLFEKDSPNPVNPVEVCRGWQFCDCSGRALLQTSRQLHMVLASICRFYFVDADYMWPINDCIMSRNICFEIKGHEVLTQVSEGFIKERWNVPLKLARWNVSGSFERRRGSPVLTKVKLRELVALYA